jgi:hypothetical protein
VTTFSPSNTATLRPQDGLQERTYSLDQRWIRFGDGAGVLACLLLLSAAFVTSNTLSSNSSTAQIDHFLTSHRSVVLIQTVLTMAGSAISLWSAATLAHMIHSHDRHSPLGLLVLVAGTAMAVVASLDGVTLTALEFLSKQGGLTDPSITRIFFDLQNGIIMPGMFGCAAAVFLVALGSAMLRNTLAARWVGWVSLGFAALSVVSSVVGLMISDGGTSSFGYFPAVGFVLVGLISNIYMLRYRAPVSRH